MELISLDFERDTCTFKVRDNGTSFTLRVRDEVLDLDADRDTRLLRVFRVAQALRQAGPGMAVLVTTNGMRFDPI